MTLQERFDEKYIPEPNSGCWLWTAHCSKLGYAKLGGKLGSRVSWALNRGALPEEMDVLHSCDNPYCVNPDHLFLGTHQDNMSDMKKKGRAKTKHGADHGLAKLTDDHVRAIRSSLERNVWWAKRLGVSETLISLVRRRRIWRHVQ